MIRKKHKWKQFLLKGLIESLFVTPWITTSLTKLSLSILLYAIQFQLDDPHFYIIQSDDYSSNQPKFVQYITEFSSRIQYSFIGNPLTVSQQYALYQNTYSSNRYRRGSYSSCAYCINFDIILAQCYLLSEVYSRKTDQPTSLKISLYVQSNPGLRHL